MDKLKKCKNCQWYGKPYWSIINPCDSCPNENDYITQVGWYNAKIKQFEKLYTEDYVKELQQRIDKAVEYINKYEYQKYCSSPYEKDKYIMREEKEGQDLLNILRGDE